MIDPEFAGDHLSASDPYQAVRTAIADKEFDRVVVLAYMGTSALKDLAKKLPNVDAVLGGPTGQVLPPQKVGQVLVSSSTNKGKFLLELTLPVNQLVDAKITEVSADIKESTEQKDNLKTFYKQLAENDFAPEQTQFVSSRLIGAGAHSISGSESCVRCHKLDDNVWHDSKHSHAWASLQTTGAHVDPACQRCHTTGYGFEGGFQTVAMSQQLVNVGCENCHGPSTRHAKDPTIRTPFDAKQSCIACHDHENSPKFEYNEYWTKIVHGPKDSQIPPVP